MSEGFCPEGTYFDGFGCYDCDYCLNTFDDSACSADTGQDCAGACGDGGGVPEQCVEGYCPEGTYYDGYGCYDCDYCLNTFDDSACSAESGQDCAGACGDGGGDPVGCSDDEFDCNGDGSECIPNNSYYICDGWLDCYNGADEADCGGGTDGCADGQFDCGDGHMYFCKFYCDGSAENGNALWGPDCDNGADEVLAECCDPDNADGYDAEDCGDDAGNTPMPGDGCTGPVGPNGWNLAGDDQFTCPLLDFFGSVSGGECIDIHFSVMEQLIV